jgi:hypothetical protein
MMGQILDTALKQTAGKLSVKPTFFAAIRGVKLTTHAGSFRFSDKNEPIRPHYVTQIHDVTGTIQPVILGTNTEFTLEPKTPQLPAGCVLPK